MSFKPHFSRFLQSRPQRLHCAAHSHHPWPDVSMDAQQRAWLDAAELIDGKWEHILGEVWPQAQRHVARVLNLPDPLTVCFAHNTHEFVQRLWSCLPRQPARVLTTDAEFHSFQRQLQRWEEAGLASAQRVAAEPFATLPQRLTEAAARGGYDLLYVSQCLFNSGYLLSDMAPLVQAVPDDETLVVIDGYHGFMAVPTDLSAVAARAFYLGGGYKYAMAGEGAAYMHCPPDYGARPLNTGWFAGFGALSSVQSGVAYAGDARRFMGATFDATGLYRFNAVQDWLQAMGVDAGAIHRHVERLQQRFLDRLRDVAVEGVHSDALIPEQGQPRGNFLTFRTPRAGELHQALLQRDVVTDYRNDRLRIGFGLYHDEDDIDTLAQRLRGL